MQPKSIGQFQIQRELGRGGMGVVYLATDTRLDRQVAIKALPGDLAIDPDRLARFQREAKLLASLNHPNVGAIHGLEQADGQQYLVLEYIEGETLADRLARGPIPVDEALTHAKQIAEALEVAHDKGIVHRDLKPGNIMVTADGVVKVLDFGLARTADGDPASSSAAALANSPTVTSPARNSPTIPGAIMGTAGYMSPEQARGKPVDKRSDIFSFGCVLYEMLSGAGPFSGETVTDSLGAILHREPNWALLPSTTPPRVRELLANCLAKDRKNRTHDIGDARLEIERTIAGHGGLSTVEQAATGKRAWPAMVGTALVAVLLAGATGWLLASELARPAAQTAPQILHLSTAVPAKPQLNAIVGISPDAQFVLYTAWTEPELDSAKPQGVLMVRRLDRDRTTVIEGTEGARAAALSPDGRWIAFSAERDRAGSKVSLKKIALDQGRPVGAPETLCDLPSGGSATLCWSSDREIVIALPWSETILAVSSAGGEPRVVLQEVRGKELDSWGDIRPLEEGRSILATRWSLVGQTIKERVEVVDLVAGKRTPLLQNASLAQYTPDGFILARRNVRTIVAARLDLDTLQIVGEPVTVWNGDPVGGFLASSSGTLALTTASGDFSKRKLAQVDDQGKLQPMAAPARSYGRSISVSPDGERVATVLDPTDYTEVPTEIWVYDQVRGASTRIPTDGPCIECVWSRDGQRLTFTTVEKEGFTIWERRADGSGERTKLHTSESQQMIPIPLDWSPDGKVLAFLTVDLSKQATDVWMLEQAADTKEWIAKPYLDSPANEQGLAFSPDGKWVRFASDEAGGRSDLYVQRFTGARSGAADSRAGRVQIPTGGVGSGWLSSDGKEYRYVDPDDQVMSVQVQTEPTFTASAPKLLYSIKDLKTKARTMAPDGQLIVVLEGEDERLNRIGVVVGFLDGARAQLSAAK